MTKNDKFRDVASRRMKTAVRSLRLLAKCGNRRVYEFSRFERSQLLNRLASELAALEDAFNDPVGDFEFRDAVEVDTSHAPEPEPYI